MVSFSAQVNCRCKRKRAQKIDVLIQKEIFDKFHALDTWSGRVKFIRKLVIRTKSDKENINPLTKMKKKNFNFSCFLVDDHGVTHQVCIPFVTKLLQVNRVKIFRAVSSIKSNPLAIDRRGKFPSRNIKSKDKQFIKQFIECFPKYEHDNNTPQLNKKYLHPDLNIKKLHELYRSMCLSEEKKALSLSFFRQFFKLLGVEFPMLRTQTCWKCSDFNSQLKKSVISVDKRTILLDKRQKHLDRAKNIVIRYQIEVQKAQESFENTEILTFGLGRPIDLPSIASTDYTKRRLWLYEICIFDEVRQLGYIYVWPETVALKDSQEIGSCLLEHLRSNTSPETKHLILYSDPYFYQNRNIKISLKLQKFLDSWPHSQLISIEQRFFVPGHGYNSCDRCFETIKKQKLNIFIPLNFVDEINKRNRKIFAIEMRTENFFSTKPLENLLNDTNFAIDGLKIKWSSYKSITYYRNTPFILRVEQPNCKVHNVVLSEKNKNVKLSDIDLPLLYPNGRYISHLKYNDLKTFVDLIPNEYQNFYESLKYKVWNIEKDYAFSTLEINNEEQTE